MEQSQRHVYPLIETRVTTLPTTGYAFQENDPEPGCSNLRSNWLCICISYQSQDRPTGAVGKGRRLGRENTLRNSRIMDQPV